MKKLFFLIITICIITSCTTENNNPSTSNVENEEVQENTEVSVEKVELFEGKDIYAFMDTSFGEIQILLYTDEAPKTTANFAIHSANGYYDNLTFHRVIDNFMIQGGDPMGTGVGGESIYGPQFEDEFFKKTENKPGTIAMANSGPNTNGSQFFINEVNNTHLDGKHTVFGEVIEGMDVVNTITEIPLDTTTQEPSEVAVINSIELFTKEGEDFVSYDIQDTEQEKNNAINNNRYLSENIAQIAEQEKALKMEADKTREVQSGDMIGVKYTLTLEDGTVVDSNYEREDALEFVVGEGQVISGFDSEVVGMMIGETKNIVIQPSEGYGEYDENNIQTVKMEMFQEFIDNGIEIKAGTSVPTQGGQLPILEVNGDDVTVDANHPLAGKILNFEIQLEYFVN